MGSYKGQALKLEQVLRKMVSECITTGDLQLGNLVTCSWVGAGGGEGGGWGEGVQGGGE